MKKSVFGLVLLLAVMTTVASCGGRSSEKSTTTTKENWANLYKASFSNCEMTKSGIGEVTVVFTNTSEETLPSSLAILFTMSSGGVLYGESIAQTAKELPPDRGVSVSAQLYPKRAVSMRDVGPMTCTITKQSAPVRY